LKVEDHQILVTLNQAGTVRQASKDLLVSQPALSQRLKQIEEHWGEKIFIRSHKRLTLTPAGEEIITFAETILEEEQRVKENISRNSSTVSGTLSLGVSSLVGQYVLPEILEEFIHAYPNVKIELQTGLSDQFREASNQYHISIIRGDPKKQEYCEELFKDHLYLVERKQTSSHISKPLIEFQSDHSFQSTVNEWFIENPSFNFSQKIKVDQIETCKQLMAHGIGMAVLPQVAIKDLSDEDYIFHPLTLESKPLTRSTWICTTDIARELPQVQSFLKVIKKTCRLASL